MTYIQIASHARIAGCMTLIFPFDALLFAADAREPLLPLWAMENLARVLLCAWLFALGGCVGSFLNVVVYRLPRRMGLAHPGSHCPSCGQAIRAWDNIPLLSWIILRGKCRQCGTPIAARYYYVELTVAMIFLIVAIFEAYLRPRHGFATASPDIRPLLTHYDPLPFWSAYGLHVSLLATLLGAALVDADGHRTPRRLFAPILALGLLIPLLAPEIRRLPALPALALEGWQVALIDGADGIACGLLLGLFTALGWMVGRKRRSWPSFRPILLLASVGVVLGWQRTAIVAVGGLLLLLIGQLVLYLLGSKARMPLAAAVACICIPMLIERDPLLWLSALMSRPPYMAEGLTFAALAQFGLAIVAGRFTPQQVPATMTPVVAALAENASDSSPSSATTPP